jgi:hypothetical protein
MAVDGDAADPVRETGCDVVATRMIRRHLRRRSWRCWTSRLRDAAPWLRIGLSSIEKELSFKIGFELSGEHFKR